VITHDTLRRANTPTIRFRNHVTPTSDIVSWHLTATQRGALLKQFDGTGAVPELFEWDLNNEPGTVPKVDGTMVFNLSVTDRTGSTVTAMHEIPIEQISIHSKRLAGVGDKTIDRYSLVLFDVRSAEFSKTDLAILATIARDIHPTSTVTITGYTDRLGDAAFNAQLAQSRAEAAARALGTPNAIIHGVGAADLYDVSVPEGRLYTRTVEIVVETPVMHN
jgi:outer membrane protein OmpA-like peptidoglycan-associated protein